MTIPGFKKHGDRYRAYVALPEAEAQAIAEEAKKRDLPVGTVLRERVTRR